HYLDPVNLLHGDVGRVRPNDLIIFISQSGETKELLEANALLAANTRIAIVGDETSTLGRECDLALVTSTFGEILPFQATAAQNAWCDAIMAAWMYLHPIDLHTTHPGGSIGRQLRERDQ